MSSVHAKRVVVLLADGARADVMGERLQSGKLPNIAQWMVEPGSFREAVTVFPSTTGPAYLPFLTGASPGPCNLPGIRWLDKDRFAEGKRLAGHRSYVGFESLLMGSDLAPHIQSIFDCVPESAAIFSSLAPRAGRRNRTQFTKIWYWYYAHLTDRWNYVDEVALQKTLRELRKGTTRFVFTVFPGVDEYSHLAHPHHASTFRQYDVLDQAVGEIASDLTRRGEWATTDLWIVSDHGLSQTHEHFCLNRFLECHDLPPFFYPDIFRRKGKLAATMVSGNAMGHLYFRNGHGWRGWTTRTALEHLKPGFLADLVQQPAVDIVAVRNDHGGIDILSRRGEARLDGTPGTLRYACAGSDPFGYEKLPPSFSRDDSLRLTFQSQYPDAPYQLAQLFLSSRTGDVVVSATPGFDLRLGYEYPEHRGSHGSLDRSHMMTPLVCNRKLVDSPCRTVDVFPSVLASLGVPVPNHVEGRPIFA
ncbi:MAG: alkaline phosphatase family protein [Deltaproteobacteria bacterium]|nr:alkaline phosphatase family protein [Deltaproteobacteria bacterium]